MRAKISAERAREIATAATRGQIARSPLTAAIFASFPDPEQMIQREIEWRAEPLTKGDFRGYLMKFDGHRRFPPFLAVHALMPDEQYWRCVALVWDNIEASAPDMAEWLNLFRSPRPRRELLMSKKEHAAFEALPDRLTLFRGYAKGIARRGMSWTLSEERAQFFATYAVGGRRAMLCGHANGSVGMVVEGAAAKRDVLAHFVQRSESEIVIDPRNVKLGRSYQWPRK